MTTPEEGLFWSLGFSFDQPDWYGGIAEELGALIRAMSVWPRFTSIQPREGALAELSDSSFERALQNPSSRGWELLIERDGEVTFECAHHRDTLSLRLRLLGGAFREFAARLEEMAWSFIGRLGRPYMLPSSGIRPAFDPDLPWERVSGRPSVPFVAYENVVDFFDPRLIDRWRDWAGGAVMERITAAPIPAGVRRVECAGIRMLAWTDDLTEPSALAAARMRHERWLAMAVAGTADRRLEIGSQVEAPPLSFVDPASRLGFKTMVVFPDGSLEQAAWEAAITVAKRGRHPKVGDLAGVYLIVPLREHAVALADRAAEAGLAGVAYPTDGGGLAAPVRTPRARVPPRT